MAKNSAPSVAYFEEADDDGQTIPGIAPKYARSTANSPSKEKPNTSRTRKDSSCRELSPTSSFSDSDTTEPPVRRNSKIKMKEEKKRGPLVKQRPAPRSHKTAPVPSSRLSDEASYYGVPQQTVASASSARPRARTRPESYYGQRPPLSTSAYAHQPPHPSQQLPPSFPPTPLWIPGPPPPMGHHALVHQPIPSPSTYGSPSTPYGDMPPPPGRDLAARFRRPSSAMGFQHAPKPLDYEPSKEKALTRRTSVSRKASKDHEDSRRMPPPPRPASTQPNRLVFRPPPPSHTASHSATRRKSVGFDAHDLAGEPGMYKAVARREVEYGSGALPGALPSRPRTQSYDAESLYDDDDPYELETATRGRRGSFYNFEEKVRDASRYQEDVAGGPGPQLTAAALQRVKNEGSSHSTRSSASRDESDYKQSATTRTTRSSNEDDDITIKLPMGAVIEVGNTKIHCRDGGDINIGRGGPTRGGGSDHAASASNYSDERNDRKSRADRAERATTRTRATSRAGSYSRTRPSPPALYAPDSTAYSTYDDYYDGRYAPQMGMGYYDSHYDSRHYEEDDSEYSD
ncbi:uncharacterized protein F4822DRAFT_181754 [Hypoxylon trugodes]|uniref:uncharacterized protein n=1 Tax=Hypoxylon trugodes TaxID=326681 RepID=UPI00219680D8|nr:uncharacterized protein F4822DRAFT_181754 [Hypoxylon trugodes]KAI1391326.1 hypothetical protein F4822DRAFT_181754 [Hypoxylon trugodes]